MNTKSIIEIFRGDDSDALGYQTIVGTIHTDLDLTGCKAVFRYLGFFQEFDPIPEDGKLTIVIPAASSIQFPPGFGYASLKVYDIDRKVRTFTNRIPVFVSTKTPCRCGGEFDVEFSPFPELEPLKIFIGPNADDYDLYTGFVMKIIDRASAEKYGLSMIYDDMDSDMGANSGVAASPVAVRAAYDAILGMLADNYYNKEQTDEQIDKLAAYYITANAQGNPFATHSALVNAQTYYSGGSVRTPTRNDYAIIVADETHNNEEWRYIYSENDQGIGQWEPQYAVEGVIAFDDYVTKASANGVKSSGIWSAIWGALSALPTGFSSLYDWCVAQFTGKFAQYYPDGSVKSTTEFTQGIKYNAPDTVNRTITVKPFCNSGTAANDNSGLIGRVVIPPFVDGDGNGYISDDGTRFKVVGVSGGGNASNQSNLSAIVAPCTVTTVGNRAFISCSSLTTVSLPAVTGVGENAFFYCSNLTSVTLPAAMTVGLGAFINCSALTSVTLPVVTNIENGAFISCSSLASVDFGDTSRPDVPMLGTSALGGVPTTCKIIVPYTQYDAWIAADGWKDLPQEFVRHAEKADKPTTFTAGNLAKFDTNGNPVDSEKKPSDFQSALSAQQLANIEAVTNKANDNAVVHRTGNETVGGVKTFDSEGVVVYDSQTGFSLKLLDTGIAVTDGYYTAYFYVPNITGGGGTFALLSDVTGKADRDESATSGNLAKFDSQGNPIDSQIPAANVAVKADLRYDLATKTIDNGAVTLDDRAINAVAVSSSLASLTINFPTATSGKVRDFAMRLNIAAGVTAPEIAWPQGVTLENDGGEVPEIADGGTGGSSTILYFSETENDGTTAKFLVKGETLTAITQA